MNKLDTTNKVELIVENDDKIKTERIRKKNILILFFRSAIFPITGANTTAIILESVNKKAQLCSFPCNVSVKNRGNKKA
jgi:hypothetical protein